jgi:hypothetical protein
VVNGLATLFKKSDKLRVCAHKIIQRKSLLTQRSEFVIKY